MAAPIRIDSLEYQLTIRETQRFEKLLASVIVCVMMHLSMTSAPHLAKGSRVLDFDDEDREDERGIVFHRDWASVFTTR